MYDKRYVSETQAQSFEGLYEAAQARGSNVYGVEPTGTDGYNFSFPILAGTNEGYNRTVKIYSDGTNSSKEGTFFQGDDTIAVTKWTQRFYAQKGFRFPTDAGWTLDLQNGVTNAIIGGAWHFNAFASTIGSSNVGLAPIPTFTITAADAYGSVAANTVYRGGSFVDPKVMMLNRAMKAELKPYAEEVIKFLSSIDTQINSFAHQGNIPAYKDFANNIDDVVANASEEIPESSVAIAKAQSSMSAYGIAQPFVNAKLNNYYYQNGAPSVYQEMVVNAGDAYGTDRKIQEGLFTMQYIWQAGKRPDHIAADLPAYCRDDNGKTIRYDENGQPIAN